MVNCLSKLMYNQIFHLFISFSSLVTATHKERSLEMINNFVSCVECINLLHYSSSRCSRDVCGSSWRETSDLLLVPSTCGSA